MKSPVLWSVTLSLCLSVALAFSSPPHSISSRIRRREKLAKDVKHPFYSSFCLWWLNLFHAYIKYTFSFIDRNVFSFLLILLLDWDCFRLLKKGFTMTKKILLSSAVTDWFVIILAGVSNNCVCSEQRHRWQLVLRFQGAGTQWHDPGSALCDWWTGRRSRDRRLLIPETVLKLKQRHLSTGFTD